MSEESIKEITKEVGEVTRRKATMTTTAIGGHGPQTLTKLPKARGKAQSHNVTSVAGTDT